MDQGSEFKNDLVWRWCRENGVQIFFSSSGNSGSSGGTNSCDRILHNNATTILDSDKTATTQTH